MAIAVPVEQFGRIPHRHLVGVEHEHLLETTPHQRIGLELPAILDFRRTGGKGCFGIDRLGAEVSQQELHARGHLGLAEMPDFDRQGAAVCDAQQVHEDEGIGEKHRSAGADEDTPPGKLVRGVRQRGLNALL